ncbi:hypothetical protein BKA64DRAFT_644950 [Cadophora sp. MPI-SDFR-AT-0126]|nr:hypothetical protein BKA64DRAFT_644950 [Leotiomycetes sp. MPI-SDFR-AT-0126]
MAVLKSTPTATATAPIHPACTIIANNPEYYTYVNERWSFCIIKQTYNSDGPNFTTPAFKPIYTTTPSPTPNTSKSSLSPDNNAAISVYVPIGIIAAIPLGFFIYCLISKIARAIEQYKRRPRRLGGRPLRVAASNYPPPPRRRTGFRDLKAWFSKNHTSLLGRSSNQDRSLESAAPRMSPLRRGLHRMRTFGKSNPRVPPPYQSPVPSPDLELDALPPAYQSVAHLPPPALPLAAHISGGGHQRARVSDDPTSTSQAQSHIRAMERPRNEPPPPDYHDRHRDILYMSETESEGEIGSEWEDNLENDNEEGHGDVDELAAVNESGRIWNEYFRIGQDRTQVFHETVPRAKATLAREDVEFA